MASEVGETIVDPTDAMAPETLVAELTPPGRGAIATVGIWGDQAETILCQVLFRRDGAPVSSLPVGRIQVCQFRCPGHPPEKVVVCRVEPRRIHVHCHGGRAAVRRVLETMAGCGARIVGWEEWLDRTTPSRWQAQCLRALAQATTPRVAAILLDQLAGAFPRELEEIAGILLAGERKDAEARTRELRLRYEVGKHLLKPWFVLLAGPTNAGKSTLFNSLVGFERVIAHPMPGTTRDVVKETVATDGWPITLADSAGFTTPADPLDQAAMTRAQAAIDQADLVLWIVDLSQEWTGPWAGANRLAGNFASFLGDKFLYVHNKADLLDVEERSIRLRGRPAGVVTSAKTGEGVEALWVAIRQRLIPQAPPPGAGVPFLPEHAELLACVERNIVEGHAGEAVAEIRRYLRSIRWLPNEKG